MPDGKLIYFQDKFYNNNESSIFFGDIKQERIVGTRTFDGYVDPTNEYINSTLQLYKIQNQAMMYFMQVEVSMTLIPEGRTIVYAALESIPSKNIIAYDNFAIGLYNATISTTKTVNNTLRSRHALCIDKYMLFNTENSKFTTWYSAYNVIPNDNTINIYYSGRSESYKFTYTITAKYTIDILYIA